MTETSDLTTTYSDSGAEGPANWYHRFSVRRGQVVRIFPRPALLFPQRSWVHITHHLTTECLTAVSCERFATGIVLLTRTQDWAVTEVKTRGVAPRHLVQGRHTENKLRDIK